MAASVRQRTAWRRGFMPSNETLAGKLNHLCQGFFDQLCRDMGETPWRKVRQAAVDAVCCCSTNLCVQGWWWLREWWGTYTVADYEGLWASQGEPSSQLAGAQATIGLSGSCKAAKQA